MASLRAGPFLFAPRTKYPRARSSFWPRQIMTCTSLTQLEARDAFIARHIGPDAAEQEAMLAVLGYASRAALIDALVPANIRNQGALALGQYTQPMPEQEALAKLKKIA